MISLVTIYHQTKMLFNYSLYSPHCTLHTSVCLVTQLCPTLCDPMDCSPPGSSVHGIFQARILEWVAISFSRESSWPRDWTWISCVACRLFTIWVTMEVCTFYLFYIWKFVPLNLSHLFFFSLHCPLLWQPPVCSLYQWVCCYLVMFVHPFCFLDSTYKWNHTVFFFLCLTYFT